MSNNVKNKNIKNQTYYFFNDIISMEHFYVNNINIDDEMSYKNILIYYGKYPLKQRFIKSLS